MIMASVGLISASALNTETPDFKRYRFRAGDIARHLDMFMVGELCLVVTVDGYKGLLDEFWSDSLRQLWPLMHALHRGDIEEITKLAHTLKGVAGTLGCVGVEALARTIHKAAPSYQLHDCQQAAAQLLEQWNASHALCSQAGFTSIPAP